MGFADNLFGELYLGKASFDPEHGMRFEVDGLLEKDRGGLFQAPTDQEAIHGIANDGTKITLLKCTGSGLSSSFLRTNSVRYHALWTIVGEHLAGFDEARYSEASISIHNLEEFLGSSGFHPDLGDKGTIISWTSPEPQLMQLDDVSVKAEFSARTSWDFFHRR